MYAAVIKKTCFRPKKNSFFRFHNQVPIQNVMIGSNFYMWMSESSVGVVVIYIENLKRPAKCWVPLFWSCEKLFKIWWDFSQPPRSKYVNFLTFLSGHPICCSSEQNGVISPELHLLMINEPQICEHIHTGWLSRKNLQGVQ